MTPETTDRQPAPVPSRLLISAFACEPGRGSEQEVGWRWAVELSRHLEVLVLTQTRNQPGIEQALASLDPSIHRLKFEYLQLPRPIYRLKSRFNCLTMPYYAIWQWLAARRAAALHQEDPFDLIHHLTFATFRVPIWMKIVGPPVVMGPVGGAERAPWRLLSYRASPAAWLREAFRNIMTSASSALLGVLPPIRPGRDICLAATPGMQHIFEKKGLPCQLLPTIGSEGVDAVPRHPRTGGSLRFLYVGRLHILKGVQLLIAAFTDPRLSGCHLTIVGSGPEESRLKAQVAESPIADRVSWMPSLPRKDLWQIYANHEVLVAPSMYESGGLVVLEAMEQGTPCIVLDVGGHSVSVTADCGIKVDPSGPAAQVIQRLSDAMHRYATDPALRELHGSAARGRAVGTYSWPSKVDRMLEIYQSLLATRDA